MKGKPLSPAESRAALGPALHVALWGVAIFAATRVLDVVLESRAIASAAAQAIGAEWGAGRLGVAWSDPKETAPSATAMAKRAALGAAVGIGAAAIVVGFLASTHAVLLERVAPAMSSLAVALVTAGLYAMRDELLLHGVAMRALVSVEVPWVKVVACGLTSAAAAYGDLGASPRAVAVAGLLGTIFGALWVRDRGAWAAWGAHGAWLFATGVLLQGGLFDARVAATAWGGANAGPLGGDAALVALLPLAAGALAGTALPRRS